MTHCNILPTFLSVSEMPQRGKGWIWYRAAADRVSGFERNQVCNSTGAPINLNDLNVPLVHFICMRLSDFNVMTRSGADPELITDLAELRLISFDRFRFQANCAGQHHFRLRRMKGAENDYRDRDMIFHISLAR